VHIDCNNGDELGSELFGELDSLDSDNELINSVKDQLIEILHGTLGTIFELIDSSLGVLCPDNQGDDQGNLSTEKLDPLVSLEVVLGHVGHLPGVQRSGPGMTNLLLERLSHHEFEILEPVLDFSFSFINGVFVTFTIIELDVLMLFGVHTVSFVDVLVRITLFDEFQTGERDENGGEIFLNLDRLGTVGEHIQEGFGVKEIESWEDLFLDFEVLGKFCFTFGNDIKHHSEGRDLGLDTVVHNTGIVESGRLKVSPISIKLFKHLGLIWEVLSDIISVHENVDQFGPHLLEI
jgi:hypothetical protein